MSSMKSVNRRLQPANPGRKLVTSCTSQSSTTTPPPRIPVMCVLVGIALSVSFMYTQGFVEAYNSEHPRHSHRSRSPQRSSRTADEELMPYFDNSTSQNITVPAGKLVHLPCRVRHLGDRTVSWIRKRDLHVLTVGRFTYTSDQRFQAIHLENSDSWTLQIQYPKKSDAGVYECQVSTVPKLLRCVTLNVIVSKATILGGPALYINKGSTLNLTCELMDTPVQPDYVFWYRNGNVFNYDSPKGISVQTEKDMRTLSRLIITNAQPSDSGNYSCVPSNADRADIAVHVLNGQNPAEIKPGMHTSASSRMHLNHLVFLAAVCWSSLLLFSTVTTTPVRGYAQR